MIELVQFPWSPYCLVQKQILDYSRVRHKIVNIPATDRSLIWRLTRRRYYQVPIVKNGRTVVFETEENSQVVAKYIDSELALNLFPPSWDGVQSILWRYLENDIESCTFRLNDIYYRENVPASEQMNYLRHKERKFGRGCIERWRSAQKELIAELTLLLRPCEQMLREQLFLLGAQPRFLDFDLWGMLANFLYSGHYKLPRSHPRLRRWYERVRQARFADFTCEKLHS